MARTRPTFLTCLIVGFLLVEGRLNPAHADAGGFKAINNADFGQVMYGPLPGESSLRGAMGSMLRAVHDHFGERPKVGKFFQAGSSDSIATFFTVTAKSAKSNSGEGRNVAGLLIVTMPRGSKPAAALLYDDASRFARSEPVMMKKLNDAWRTEAAKSAPAARAAGVPSAGSPPAGAPADGVPGRSGAVPPLHQASGGDRSASIGLPAGWKITAVGGGSLSAAGPNGEVVNLGIMIQNIYDLRTQQGRQLAQYMRMSRKPFVICPYGDDLARSYLGVTQQNRSNFHLRPVTIKITSSRPAPASPYESRAVVLKADLDMHDGKAPLQSNVRVGAMRPVSPGMWAMTVTEENVPKRLVAEEWPTIMAMVATYRQNGKVIFAETKAVIDDIHANAAAAKQRADATSAANDAAARQRDATRAADNARSGSAEAGEDDNAKYNKSFENYLLDRTVIQDNEKNERGTADYGLGDALVKSDPNRFQYVETKDLLKGVDY